MADSTAAPDGYSPPDRVLGVDFSAARRDAGEHVWVAELACDAEPRVVDCSAAVDRFDCEADRDATLRGLTHHLAGVDADWAAGLDFPFALPRAVVVEADWETFLRHFPDWFDDPTDLQRRCQSRANLAAGDRVQYTRVTEDEVSGLSPYDRRLRAQTFYGVRDLLRPLVLADAVRAVPMQALDSDRPTLLEVYPAATLDRLDAETHRENYKDASEEARRRREANVEAVEAAGVAIPEATRELLLADDGGDALDAVLAAVATWHNTADPSNLTIEDERRRVEGHIYV